MRHQIIVLRRGLTQFTGAVGAPSNQLENVSKCLIVTSGFGNDQTSAGDLASAHYLHTVRARKPDIDQSDEQRGIITDLLAQFGHPLQGL